MKTVVLAATKGGVGKSTLCSAFAVLAAGERKTVAMVDLDPQGSLTQWYARRLGGEDPDDDTNPALYEFDTAPEAVKALADLGVDWLFIDTGPGLLQSIESSVKAADIVVIPIKTSAFDLEAVDPVLEVVGNLKRPYLMVLNEVDPRATRMTTSAKAYLEAESHPFAQQAIPQRTPYRAALTHGKTGTEVEKDGKCADEMKALWSEVKKAVAKGARVHA